MERLVDPLTTVDAKLWADEFMKVKARLGEQKFDHAMMLGWFANAIMQGYDEGQRRAKADAQATVEALQRERDEAVEYASRPTRVCDGCGRVSSNGWIDRVIEYMDGTEYEMECPVCGVRDIEEDCASDLVRERDDLQAALDAEREKVKRLSTCGTDHSTPWWQVRCEDLEQRAEALRRERDQWKEAFERSCDDTAHLKAALDATTPARFTKEELTKWWHAQCPQCGWDGLSRDCAGDEPIADTGDYADPICPMCDQTGRCVVVDDYVEPKGGDGE